MALRSAAELRALVTSFREMAQFGIDPLLQASLLEAADDIEMEILAIEAAAALLLNPASQNLPISEPCPQSYFPPAV